MVGIKDRTFSTVTTGRVVCIFISIQTKGSKFDSNHWHQYLTFTAQPFKCWFSAAALVPFSIKMPIEENVSLFGQKEC
jgi:hypothetical protein